MCVFKLREEDADFDAVYASCIIDETVGHGTRTMTFPEHIARGVETCDFSVIGEPEGLQDEREESDFFDGIIFVDIGANVPDIDACFEEASADFHGIRRRRRISIGARIRNNGRIERLGNWLCEFDVECVHEVEDNFAGSGSLRIVEIEVTIFVRLAVVIDENAFAFKIVVWEFFSDEGSIAAIDDDEEIVIIRRNGMHDVVCALDKHERLWDGIEIVDGHIFAECFENEPHREFGTGGIAVRSAVCRDEDILRSADDFDHLWQFFLKMRESIEHYSSAPISPFSRSFARSWLICSPVS